jgi:hypothetical protein
MTLRVSIAVVFAAGMAVPAVQAQEAAPHIVTRITATAEARYADPAIRKAYEESQVAAYRFLVPYAPSGIPTEILQRVKAGIGVRFPDDYFRLWVI